MSVSSLKHGADDCEPERFVLKERDDKEQIREEWLSWKKKFEIFLSNSGAYDKLTEEERVFLLQNKIKIQTTHNINFANFEEKSDLDTLMKKFDELFNPPVNECVCRYDFFSSKIGENQTYDVFAEILKQKAKTCHFGGDEEKFIMDIIILNADDLLKKMIFDWNPTCLEHTLAICKLKAFNEETYRKIIMNKGSQSAKEDDTLSIHSQPSGKYVFKKPCWRCKTKHDFGQCPAKLPYRGEIVHNNIQGGNAFDVASIRCQPSEKCIFRKPCWKCKTTHDFMYCPARNHICEVCRKIGHFSGFCY